MRISEKSPSEIYRDLQASGVFERATQKQIAEAIGVNQGTISRIQNGKFARVNKTVRAVCKYAQIRTSRTTGSSPLRALVASAKGAKDPKQKILVDIIGLAFDLLERA